MRWLFLFVLLLNVAYVTWELNRPIQQLEVRKSFDPKVKPLVLVSEVALQDIQIKETIKAKEDVKSVVADATKTVKPELKPDPKPNVKKVSKTVTKSPSKPIVAPTAKLETKTVSKPLIKPERQPDACYTLGPYRDLTKLKEMSKVIKKHVVKSSYRSREEKEQSLFWVYLPPQKTDKAVQQLSKRLINKKIRDYYVINDGPKKNGISLGHFKEKIRAVNLAKQLRQKGFKAEIEPVFKTYLVHWLDYKVKSGNQIPAKILDKYTRSGVSQIDRKCL